MTHLNNFWVKLTQKLTHSKILLSQSDSWMIFHESFWLNLLSNLPLFDSKSAIKSMSQMGVLDDYLYESKIYYWKLESVISEENKENIIRKYFLEALSGTFRTQIISENTEPLALLPNDKVDRRCGIRNWEIQLTNFL